MLRAFRANETELTNTDLSQRTGLPKATVSRLTHTLCKLDYLVADPRTGSYRLGVGVLQLGFGVLCGMEITDRAAHEMRDLRNGPNSYVTVALAERHQDQAVYIAVQCSKEELSLTMHVGSRLPLYFSAIGRAILVGMADADRQASLEAARRTDPEGHGAREASLSAALNEYRARGFCSSYGEWRRDVNGIAVPVFTLSGQRLYGLNVGGPSFHVKQRLLETTYAPRLIAAAEALRLRPMPQSKTS